MATKSIRMWRNARCGFFRLTEEYFSDNIFITFPRRSLLSFLVLLTLLLSRSSVTSLSHLETVRNNTHCEIPYKLNLLRRGIVIVNDDAVYNCVDVWTVAIINSPEYKRLRKGIERNRNWRNMGIFRINNYRKI